MKGVNYVEITAKAAIMMYIRAEFEDGSVYIVERVAFSYDADFDELIAKHGNICALQMILDT